MTQFLLDTNILSELAPGRRGLPDNWVDVLENPSDNAFLSALSLVEIEEGISKLRRTGGTTRAHALRRWFDDVIDLFTDNIIEVDTGLALRLGQLSDEARARGRHPGLADLAIAATAEAGALILLTRNIRHFEPLGIAVIDPFMAPPP